MRNEKHSAPFCFRLEAKAAAPAATSRLSPFFESRPFLFCDPPRAGSLRFSMRDSRLRSSSKKKTTDRNLASPGLFQSRRDGEEAAFLFQCLKKERAATNISRSEKGEPNTISYLALAAVRRHDRSA